MKSAKQGAKKMAKIMRDELRLKYIFVKLSFCYEVLSHMHGFKNWDTYSAILKTQDDIDAELEEQ